MKKEFYTAIAIDKKTIFEISYMTLPGNKKPYFSTSASKFNRIYSDYTHCGQAQDELLPAGVARNFWEKWDCEHLNELSDEKLNDLLNDIEELKKHYPSIESTSREMSFGQLRDFIKDAYGLNDPFAHIDVHVTKTGERDYMFSLKNKRTNATHAGEYHGPEKPTKVDILAALAADADVANTSFVEFVNEYGHNNDLENAEDIYNACKHNAAGLRKLGIDYNEIKGN